MNRFCTNRAADAQYNVARPAVDLRLETCSSHQPELDSDSCHIIDHLLNVMCRWSFGAEAIHKVLHRHRRDIGIPCSHSLISPLFAPYF